MQQWSTSDADNPQSDIPKYIYTIPTCGNPTGASASLERKKEIYEVISLFTVIYLYFYVQISLEQGSQTQVTLRVTEQFEFISYNFLF